MTSHTYYVYSFQVKFNLIISCQIGIMLVVAYLEVLSQFVHHSPVLAAYFLTSWTAVSGIVANMDASGRQREIVCSEQRWGILISRYFCLGYKNVYTGYRKQQQGVFMEESECPLSVWNLIVAHVPEPELPEIRGLFGDALIDMYTEIYTEVTMWQQIWQAVRHKLGIRPKTPHSPLADPPAINELLKAEIQLLLGTVRERAAVEGRDGDADIFRYSPSVLNYALGVHNNRCDTVNSRPPSSGIQFSQSQHAERSCSWSSVSSTTSQDDIDGVRHKLNVTHIDDVVAHLKSVLTEECKALKRQVQFLQETVEQEHQTQRDVTEAPEPTVTELKEERRAIQMDLKRQKPQPHLLSLLLPCGNKPAEQIRVGLYTLLSDRSKIPVLPLLWMYRLSGAFCCQAQGMSLDRFDYLSDKGNMHTSQTRA
uniref:Coiled-coil domain containing 24 n=1 Tax=Hucho hucho TaxID=62062 RepID=A0A4W5JX62_9TELE